MSVPKIIFIDTNIFDESNYNFESSKLSAFISAVKDESFVLLLPDIINREINQHLSERIDYVFNAMDDIKRKAPFVSKWEVWPKDTFRILLLRQDLKKIADKGWQDFLNVFTVENLNYDNIDVNEIMDWYFKARAPFGDGKKRKEFPDAFSIAAIVNYANTNGNSIAVISKDTDIKNSCDLYTQLLYFKSLPKFTEAILSSDSNLEKAKSILEKDKATLEEAVEERFSLLEFSLISGNSEIDELDSIEIHFNDLSIIGLGELECTITFDAEVDFRVGYEIEVTDDETYYHSGRESSYETEYISWTAKVIFDADWTKIETVNIIDINETTIEIYDVDPYDIQPDY